jgi:NAD(P)H-dependent FMN reductase
MAVEVALQGAQELGAQTRLLNLHDYDLVFFDGDKDDRDPSAGMLALRREVRAAQGIILGTPEYHGSYSGVLKNTLDLMGFDEFEGKMLGLVGVSGGKIGAVDALNALRTVGRALHAWVVPQQVSVPEAWRIFNADGSLKDKRLEAGLKQVGQQVARFAFLHNSEQVREFLRLWETAPLNPGGGATIEQAA